MRARGRPGARTHRPVAVGDAATVARAFGLTPPPLPLVPGDGDTTEWFGRGTGVGRGGAMAAMRAGP